MMASFLAVPFARNFLSRRRIAHVLRVVVAIQLIVLPQILLPVSTALVLPSQVYAQGEPDASKQSDHLVPGEEVVDLRTQTSKTFFVGDSPDGSKFSFEGSMGPIHYKEHLGDASEDWKDIDTTIEPTTGTYQYSNTKNSFKSFFKQQSTDPKAVRYQVGSASISYTLLDNELGELQTVAGKLAGNSFEYQHAYPTASVRFSVQSVRLLEEFVFEQYQPVDSISQRIEFSNAHMEPEGNTYVFTDPLLKTKLWTIAEPVLYELNNPTNRSYGIHYETKCLQSVVLPGQQCQDFMLIKVLDAEGKAWLADADRQFPVVIDATFDADTAASADDAILNDSAYDDSATTILFGGVGTSPNANFGQGFRFTNVTIGQNAAVDTAYISLMKDQAAWTTVNSRLTAIDEDNTSTFSSGSAPGSRSITSSYIADESQNISKSDGTRYNWPDDNTNQTTLGNAVQAVFARGGWSSGNALGIVSNSDQDASAYQSFAREIYRTYDYGTPSTNGPKIHIDYTAYTFEQEGFRFRADDGNETTATWLASQDTNITRATATNTRLRMLVNTTDDAPSNRYQLEYKKSTDTGYQKVGAVPSTATPVVETRSTGASAASNTTSHAITMPASIAAGDLLLLVFSSDGSPDMSIASGGWIRLDQAYNSTVAGGAVFYKFAEGSDTATVTTSATEQSSHVVLRISGAGVPYSASSNGSSTNSDPPNLDVVTSRNHLWVATRSGDSTVVATVAPTGYSNLQSQAAAGTGGASTNTAEKAATASSDDPGTFTSNTEQWASFTIAVPPADSNGGARYLAAQSSGTTSLSLAYPANISAGDLLVMSVANKHTSNAPSTPSGWTAPSNNQASGTSGSDAADTGSVYSTVFTKIADGTETGNVSVTITSGNSATGNIVSLRAASGKVWSTALTNGSDTTINTAWSVTGAADPGITSGDVVITASGINTDAYLYTVPSLTATSVTFANTGKLSEAGTTNGNDLEMVVTAHVAMSGTSSAAPVFAMTSSGSATNAPAGATVFVRARQSDAPIQLIATANITASGDNTTAQLTAPSGKSTSDFVTGRMQDDENPADAIDITTSDYTELEWSLIATSAATNGDIYQFRVTVAGTAFNTYTVTPQWTIGAGDSTYTLSSYRWYVDNDSENVAAVWGNPDVAEDTALTLLPATNATPVNADEIRLRVAITIGTANLSASTQQFKLQYKAGTDESCTTGSWTDVGAGGGGVIWRYATSTVTDGTTLTVLKLTVSDVLGVYAKASPTATNPNGANTTQALEYDFHLQHNAAGNATTYSFRVVESDGTVLSTYSECPTLSTRQIVDQELRHGNVFGDEIERGFTRLD